MSKCLSRLSVLAFLIRLHLLMLFATSALVTVGHARDCIACAAAVAVHGPAIDLFPKADIALKQIDEEWNVAFDICRVM